MKAANFSRSLSRAGLVAAVLVCASCYHREANILVAPVPIQVDSSRVEGRGVPMVGPRWHRLQPGMTKSEVIHFAGEPTHREYEGDSVNGSGEIWYYESYDIHDGHFDPHKVTFDHGRLISASFDQARVEQKKREKKDAAHAAYIAEIIPDDVGSLCASDDVCHSKSCINNRCAGPHGCTRGIGDDCLADSDCCSHHCNAGGRVCE